jgi:hypothetical protein
MIFFQKIGTYFDNLQDHVYNTKNIKLKECKIDVESDTAQHGSHTSNKQVCKCISLYNL